MHMGDGLVTPIVAGAMYACSAGVAAYSIKKMDLDENKEKICVMGVMGAFVFAAQMINFGIPGTGSSGHLSGAMLLAAILGPYGGFLSMIGVLVVQALIFGDGGILALGCNIWNMAFYGCFIGAMVIWKLAMKDRINKKKIIIASIIGSVLTLQLGAFSVTLQTLASGVSELPFGVFLASMQPIHLAIGVVEGIVTAGVLSFIYESRPEYLWCYKGSKEKVGRLSYKGTIGVLVITTVIIGGMFSLVASSNPDGLEWSIERVAGVEEIEGSTALHQSIGSVQESLAIFPDYSFKSGESIFGTSVSGIVGGGMVALFTMAMAIGIKNKKELKES